MSKRLGGLGERMRPRLTYANVISTVALFAVLGGGAYATHTHRMGTQDLKNRAVTTAKLDRRAVGTGKLKPRAVGPGRLRNRAVGPAKLRPDTVRARHIAASTKGVALAGVVVGFSGDVQSWFNRFGGAPTVEMPFDGRFELEFPGVEDALEELGMSSVHVAVPSGATVNPHRVHVRRLSGTPGLVDITTWDHNDEQNHRGFHYVMYAGVDG